MWVCSVCGLELDDSMESCPFGCGTSRVNDNVDKAATVSSMASTYSFSDDERVLQEIGQSSGGFNRVIFQNEHSIQSKENTISLDKAKTAVSENAESFLVLTEGRTGQRIKIDSIACVLGREGDYCPEIFSEQVSRIHMEISRSGGTWKACHVGMNPSVLVTSNGRINMEPGIEYPLHGGERIRMANQTFMVDVEAIKEVMNDNPCRENEQRRTIGTETGQDVHSNTVECWCIACPKCGAKYRVQDSNDRVHECVVCTDPMDKKDIRRVSPVFGLFMKEDFVDACC